MAVRRTLYDEFGNAMDDTATQDYWDTWGEEGVVPDPQPLDWDYDGSAEGPYGVPGRPQRPGQPAPAPTPAAPAWDRQAFQNKWMSSSGTFDDFIKQNPQFAPYVKAQGSSKDRYVLNNDEVLDLLFDEGGANRHAWTGTGFNAQGVADKPVGAAASRGGGETHLRQPSSGASAATKARLYPGDDGYDPDQDPGGNGHPNKAYGQSQGDGGGQSVQSAPAPQPTRAAQEFASMEQQRKPDTSIDDMIGTLKGLFPDGAFNQDVVNRRTDISRDNLNRYGKSRMDTNRAILAERGTLGSGPEMTAMNRSEEDMASQFASAQSGIIADESENADQRMMQALSLAAGLSSEQAQNLIDTFRATTERDYGYGRLDLDRDRLGSDTDIASRRLSLDEMLGTGDLSLRDRLGSGQLDLGNRNADIDEKLGLGNLALGNMNGQNSYNLGLAGFGLDRDRLAYDMENGDIDRLLAIIEQWNRGNTTASNGSV